MTSKKTFIPIVYTMNTRLYLKESRWSTNSLLPSIFKNDLFSYKILFSKEKNHMRVYSH